VGLRVWDAAFETLASLGLLRTRNMQSIRRSCGRTIKRIELLRPQALLVGADPFFNSRREQLVTLAKE